MELGLSGKKVLITGATKGIGAATASLFAAEGCSLVLVARTQSDLEEIRDELQATGAKVEVAAVDLSTKGISAQLAKQFPDIDILVNNAGEDPAGRVTDISEETWQKAMDIKSVGYVNMARAFYPLMQARGSGVIVNLIGVMHVMHEPLYIAGGFTCGALVSFTEALGAQSLKDGIRVVGVAPGVTATTRLMKTKALGNELRKRGGDGELLSEDTDPETVADRIASKLGLARAGKPSELASVIVFAASSAASYVTGSVIYVDGGLV